MGPWGLLVDYRGCGAFPSCSGGTQTRPTLGSLRLPSHSILLGNPPNRGGAWLNCGFSIL